MLRETGSLDFGVIRLVRGDRRWWFEGSTHEYIATDGRFDQEQLDSLLIEHHARRRRPPAEADPRRRPAQARPRAQPGERRAPSSTSPRPSATSASTSSRSSTTASASNMRGWNEEVFYANLQEGILRPSATSTAGVPVLLEAWQRRPTRAEPLYELARLLPRARRFRTRAPVRQPRPRGRLPERHVVHSPLGLRLGHAARASARGGRARAHRRSRHRPARARAAGASPRARPRVRSGRPRQSRRTSRPAHGRASRRPGAAVRSWRRASGWARSSST